MKTSLLAALVMVAVMFAVMWMRAVTMSRSHRDQSKRSSDAYSPSLAHLLIGLATDFLDTLGIGSFATTTSLFRLLRLVPDQHIPGTLNVGHSLPTILEAFLYITLLEVDIRTLILMIGASVGGAWLGAGVVSGWPRRSVQLGMGIAMMAAACLMIMTQFDLFPGGGSALGLHGPRLLAAVVGNFTLGALMTLGIGLYAPCMILVSLLGMNPTAAFPIMMGSCAFLMPVGSARFIRQRRYDFRAAFGLTVGGLPGVLLAAFIVKSLPLGAVRWLVVVVVVYTSAALLRAANNERKQPSAPAVGAAVIS